MLDHILVSECPIPRAVISENVDIFRMWEARGQPGHICRPRNEQLRGPAHRIKAGQCYIARPKADADADEPAFFVGAVVMILGF
jgi:hypothetical protein